MKWALLMIFLHTPIETGLTFDTLTACYKAEDGIAAQQASYFNDWVQWAKAHPQESAYPPVPDFIKNRMMRGICVPRKG